MTVVCRVDGLASTGFPHGWPKGLAILLIAFVIIFTAPVASGYASTADPDTGGKDYAVETSTSGRQAWLLTIDGAISPAVSDYVTRRIEQAGQAALIILRINTPGGLDNAMRDIIQGILHSPVPVVTYVAPEGARAASAGTYILFASHVAAMAPATNLGAATPVQMGSSQLQSDSDNKDTPEPTPFAQKGDAMERKIVNDAVAYIRGLAELRGRNADWAEQAVREGASLGSTQALEQNVIDLIATDTADLLQKIHGYQVVIDGQDLVINTENLTVHAVEPDWRSELLAIIADPNLAYIFMLIGIYGLIFEFSNPGMGGPGIIGAICLLLALYALQVLPVSYVGLGLVLLGIALMVAEALAPSFGVLGIGGVVSFVIGSVMLYDTRLPAYQIAWPLIAAFTLASFVLFVFVLNLARRANKKPVTTGNQSWIGRNAIAVEDFTVHGHVHIDGELWRAETARPVKKGERLVINAVEGLELKVDKEAIK